MSIHFQQEMTQLRKSILGQGAMVEETIAKAIAALLSCDASPAEEVIGGDDAIDRQQRDVESDCLRILALYQPVARDLRFIVAVLKMNSDLERMADHAVSIAKRARYLCRHEPLVWPPELEIMAENVKMMVKKSLDALIAGDAALARQVLAEDDRIDKLKRFTADTLRDQIIEQPELRETILKMIDVPRHLERIADLATNIAEDIIYLAEGRDAPTAQLPEE